MTTYLHTSATFSDPIAFYRNTILPNKLTKRTRFTLDGMCHLQLPPKVNLCSFVSSFDSLFGKMNFDKTQFEFSKQKLGLLSHRLSCNNFYCSYCRPV